MKYKVKLNDRQRDQYDYEVRWDGTLSTLRKPTEKQDTLDIMVWTEGEQVSHRQFFTLFCVIMRTHQDISLPVVEGDLTWDQIAVGAK